MGEAIAWLRAELDADREALNDQPAHVTAANLVATLWAFPLVMRCGFRVWGAILHDREADPEIRELWRLTPIEADIPPNAVFEGAIFSAVFGGLMLMLHPIDPAANPLAYAYAKSMYWLLALDPLAAVVTVVIDR